MLKPVRTAADVVSSHLPMRLLAVAVLCMSLAACGGSSPSSPTPVPARVTVTATLTNTVSGAQVTTTTTEVAALPALLPVSAPGFLARSAWVTSATPTIDLIPDAQPFDLEFYRQLARGTLTEAAHPLRILTQAPSIYLQSAGLSAANVAALEQAARAVVPAMTGGKFTVTTFETGAEVRPERSGWIVVELLNDDGACGRAAVGAAAGHVWMNTASKCTVRGLAIHPPLFAHELTHSLGFRHVDSPRSLMNATALDSATVGPTEAERYHAAIAYKRTRGNADIDVDPAGGVSAFRARQIVE